MAERLFMHRRRVLKWVPEEEVSALWHGRHSLYGFRTHLHPPRADPRPEPTRFSTILCSIAHHRLT